MMAKNFRHRTHATQRYAGTTAGFYNDFIHIGGAQANYPVTPQGGYVLQRVIFNTSPASGAVTLMVGGDMLASISSTNAVKDVPYNCYLYDKLLYSTDVTCDVTFVVTKGYQQTSATTD